MAKITVWITWLQRTFCIVAIGTFVYQLTNQVSVDLAPDSYRPFGTPELGIYWISRATLAALPLAYSVILSLVVLLAAVPFILLLDRLKSWLIYPKLIKPLLKRISILSAIAIIILFAVFAQGVSR